MRTNTKGAFRNYQVEEIIALFGDINVTQDSPSVITIKLPASDKKMEQLCHIVFKTNTVIISRYSSTRKCIINHTKTQAGQPEFIYLMGLYACMNKRGMDTEYYRNRLTSLRNTFYLLCPCQDIKIGQIIVAAHVFCDLYLYQINKCKHILS